MSGIVSAAGASHFTAEIVLAAMQLGSTCSGYLYDTYEDFLDGVRVPGHPIRSVVQFCINLRKDRRTVLDMNVVLGEIFRRDVSRRVQAVLRRSFGLYCAMRTQAVPRAEQPRLSTAHGFHLPRRVEQTLAQRGVNRAAVRPTAPLEDLANARLLQLWDSMAGRHVVVWVDNYYRRSTTQHPWRRLSTGINCTVLSVLHTCALPPFTRFVDIDRWDSGRTAAVHALTGFHDKFHRMLDQVVLGQWSDANIRVPLDVHRDGVRALQWKPLGLKAEVIGSQKGLLAVLDFMKVVAGQCNMPSPLLVDINIHYRIQRFMFAPACAGWKVQERLVHTPPVFAVWHVYKQCCTVVRRRFFSVLAYLERGTVDTWLPAKPHLRNTEVLLGAVLMLPLDVKAGLRANVTVCGRKLEELLPDVPVGDRVARRRYCQRMAARAGVDATEVLRRLTRLTVAEGMLDLVLFFAPCCFLMGWLVRNCHWAGRERGTGEYAWEAIAIGVHVLRGCDGDAVRKTEYYRSMMLVMASWTAWYKDLPGCCFSEEICEAGLSRLSRLLADHSHRNTLRDANHLYLMVNAARQGRRTTTAQAVSSVFLDEVVQRICHLVREEATPVAYTPWSSSPRIESVEWDYNASFPEPCERLQGGDLKLDILHAQRTLLSSSTLNDEVVAQLNKTFDKHEDEHPQVRAQLIERWLQEHPLGTGVQRLVRRALPEITERQHRGAVFEEAMPADEVPARAGAVRGGERSGRVRGSEGGHAPAGAGAGTN